MAPSENRGRISVNLSANWRLYTNTLPGNSRALGTVTRGTGDTGVLVLIESTGQYVQVNAGAMRTLPQGKVTAALDAARSGTHGGPGRGGGKRAADGATGLKRRNVSIDDASADILRAFGDGDLSLGIRRAAANIKDSSRSGIV